MYSCAPSLYMNPPNFFLLFLGELISRIREMGREDAVKILQAGCSIYRIITLEESMSLPTVLDNDDSLVLQQNGGSTWILLNFSPARNFKSGKFSTKRHKFVIHHYLYCCCYNFGFLCVITIYVFDQYSFVKEKNVCFLYFPMPFSTS